ncbi:hypothetical protein TgHK011_005439 [Trichoderma gracile]|nr:hypothetical protein TgHK011_005439 [Trichoderma gracile]
MVEVSNTATSTDGATLPPAQLRDTRNNRELLSAWRHFLKPFPGALMSTKRTLEDGPGGLEDGLAKRRAPSRFRAAALTPSSAQHAVCGSVVTERAEPRQHRLLLRSHLSPPRSNRARCLLRNLLWPRARISSGPLRSLAQQHRVGETLAKPSPDMPRLDPLVTRCQLDVLNTLERGC